MRNRGLVLVLLLLLLAAVSGGVALGEHGPWDGYCDGDKPVFTHLPPPDPPWKATCYKGAITITYPPLGPPDQSKPLPKPPDFGSYVFIYINGQAADNPYRDVNPFIAESTGRTLVPIRFITEALGGQAEWFETERKVRLTWHDKYMEMVIGKPDAVANGRTVILDQPPLIIYDRTVVPARAVAEAFGAKVGYIPEKMRVTIDLEGAKCPPRFCLGRGD